VKGRKKEGGARRKQGERADAAISYEITDGATVSGALQGERLVVEEGREGKRSEGKGRGEGKDTAKCRG